METPQRKNTNAEKAPSSSLSTRTIIRPAASCRATLSSYRFLILPPPPCAAIVLNHVGRRPMMPLLWTLGRHTETMFYWRHVLPSLNSNISRLLVEGENFPDGFNSQNRLKLLEHHDSPKGNPVLATAEGRLSRFSAGKTHTAWLSSMTSSSLRLVLSC